MQQDRPTQTSDLMLKVLLVSGVLAGLVFTVANGNQSP
jgi:hypothetical protein